MAEPQMQEPPPANQGQPQQPQPPAQPVQQPVVGIEWVERLHDWIESNDDQNFLNRFVKTCSQRFHVTKWQAFLVGFFILMAFMLGAPGLAPMTCDFLCVGFGDMATLTAAAKRNWNELGHWLVYWIVFEAISCFDFLIVTTTIYLPVKLILMAYMGLPPLLGARALRQQWIDPIMYEGQEDFVNLMKQAHPRLLKWLEIDTVLMATMTDADCRHYVNQKKKALRAKLFCNVGAGPSAN